jgi:hypothetical protein
MAKIFCGNGNIAPPGYDALGTRYECLRKGFGAGKYSSYNSYKDNTFRYWLFLMVVLAIGAGVAMYLSSHKSSDKDEKNYINRNDN